MTAPRPATSVRRTSGDAGTPREGADTPVDGAGTRAADARATIGDAGALPAELLLSGLLVEQADEALAAFPAFAETARTDDGTWVTLHLSRRA